MFGVSTMTISWIFSISSILLLTWEMVEYRDNKKVADVAKNPNDQPPAFSVCIVTTLIAMAAAPLVLFLKSVAWMERNC